MFRGPLFETLVVTEILKACLNRRREGKLYYWRDSNGHEIDLLIETGETLLADGQRQYRVHIVLPCRDG